MIMSDNLDTRPVRTGDDVLSEPQLSVIRAELEELRTLRTEQLAELAGEMADAVVDDDQSRRQMIKVLEVTAEAALRDIEVAVQRLGDGSYGFCERCAEPIPAERLEILPMTSLCTPCQRLADAGRYSPGRSNRNGRPVVAASRRS